jgi:hypothetical protein
MATTGSPGSGRAGLIERTGQMDKVTPRGWAVVFLSAFLVGALFPFDLLPWNQ